MEAFLENSCTFINWCVKGDLSVKIAFRKRRVRGIKKLLLLLEFREFRKNRKICYFWVV